MESGEPRLRHAPARVGQRADPLAVGDVVKPSLLNRSDFSLTKVMVIREQTVMVQWDDDGLLHRTSKRVGMRAAQSFDPQLWPQDHHAPACGSRHPQRWPARSAACR